MNSVVTKVSVKPIDVVRQQLSLPSMKEQLSLALPPHVSVDKFLRVGITALQQSPSLLSADRNSLLASFFTAAQLGLLPDAQLGEAYFVPFKGKVQLIPGYRGLLTRLLSRQGARVRVFEQATAFERIGAGIQMSPNAMHVLRALGLEPLLRQLAFEPPAWTHRVWDTGEHLADLTFGAEAERRYGAPYLLMHRGDLHAAILSAVPLDVIQFDKKLVDLDQKFQLWRFSHMKTVERIIGNKTGTGGTAGVPYLTSVIGQQFFPELLKLRTSL